jgi:formylglycine-generating enzyme required for sulfatase activity
MTHDHLGIVGTTIGGKYQVEAAVGEGSFSYVYRARHLVWHTPVALKCFRGFSDVSLEARARLLQDFIQEGQLLSELSGRSATIVQARDAGTLVSSDGEDLPYIVLEWLEGRSLENILQDQRAIFGPKGWPLEKAKHVIAPLAEVLGMVHHRGIAHRDIKPDNIWIGGSFSGDETFVKLLDFGIAKVVRDIQRREFQKTKGAVTSFTPAYGAPEQFSRALGATGPWTDVYALALVFTELLVGRPALDGEDFVQLGMGAIDPARRPTPRTLGVLVDDALEQVLAKALAVKPEDRYQSADAFWRAVSEADRPSSYSLRPVEGPAEPSPASRRWWRRRDARPSHPGRSRLRSLATTTLLSLGAGGLLGLALRTAFPEVRAHWSRAISARAGSVADAFTKAVKRTSVSPASAAGRPAGSPCPDEMAMIEGGKFVMGADDRDASASEGPSHQVTLSPFCIDRKEVTVAAYKLCAEEGKCERAPFEVEWKGITRQQKKVFSAACNGDDPEKSVHPVNCVDWSMAVQYCSFAGKRLPSEAEWELAARGTDGRVYPWGDDPPDATRVNACGSECTAWSHKSGADIAPLYQEDDGFALTAPVGSFPRGRSPYGLFDMAGNVWEWVGDWEAPYPPDAAEDPGGPKLGTKRVLRGGAFTGSAPTWVRATRRYGDLPETRSHAYGFRCAKPVSR